MALKASHARCALREVMTKLGETPLTHEEVDDMM
jgi:hypothetical protein